MTNKDDFDGEEAGAFSAVNTIMGALERQREVLGERRPAMIAGVAGLMIVALVGIIWVSYPRGEQADAPVPTILADAAPVKTVPADREGMDIPHRDSTVFDTIRANPESLTKVENLLDDTQTAEQPIDRAETFAAVEENKIPEPAAVNETVTETTEVPKQDTAALTPEKPVFSEEVATKEEPVKPESVKTAAAPKKESVVEKIAKTEPASGTEGKKEKSAGTYFVQLSSVSSSDAAKVEWKKLQKEFPKQLGDLSLRVKTADLGAKGTYYRVQAGSLSEGKAKSVCDAIKAKRAGGCLVVRP
jgi:hypothetical protein